MKSSNFTFQQLDFVFTGHDDATSPVGPTLNDILATTKALYDGLKAIRAAHPDIGDTDIAAFANSDKVKAKTQLLYSLDVVTKIVGFLEGTSIFSTSVPADLNVTVPKSLVKKLKYDAHGGILTATGFLTISETEDAKALLDDAPGSIEAALPEAQATEKGKNKFRWDKAIELLKKKAVDSFRNTLAGVISSDVEDILLAGDIPESNKALSPDGKTATEKRKAFLGEFIPFLRGKLDQVFVLDTMASVAGIADRELTRVLLEDVITGDNEEQSALNLLVSIQDQPDVTEKAWTGYLTPPTTDIYVIFTTSSQHPPPISIEEQSYSFPNSLDDPPHTWCTEKIPLDSGKLYTLDATGQDITELSWRSSRGAKS
jgi:hypothetical protein